MFDPYRDWLGLTDDRRPPTLYQLLGVSPIENDPKIIEVAVARQLAKVQNHLTSSKSKLAWQLVDELTLAKTTLLDPIKRSAYDLVFGTGPKPMAPAAASNWAQQLPPSPVAAPPFTPPIQAAPAQVFPFSPQPAPEIAATPHSFNVLEDSEIEAPTEDGLPAVTSLKKPRVKRGNSKLPLFVGSGVLVLGLVGAVIVFGSRKDPEKKIDVAEQNQPEQPSKKDVPKESAKDTNSGKKNPPTTKPLDSPPKKKEPPPKNDPPPVKVETATEFKEAKIYGGAEKTARALAVSADGKRFLSVGDDKMVNSWSPASDKPVHNFKTHDEGVPGAAFLPGGREAIIADAGQCYLIDMDGNSKKRDFKAPSGGVVAISVASDGKHFLSAMKTPQLIWWDVQKESPERTIELGGNAESSCLAMTSDGKIALVGNRGDGMVGVWNVADGKLIKKWKAHDQDVVAAAFSPDGRQVATVGQDKLGKVWNPNTGGELLTLKGHTDVPIAVAYSPDGSLIFTTGIDQSVRAWDAATGAAQLWSFQAGEKIFSLAVDANDRFLIVGLSGGPVQMLFLPAVRPDSVPKASPIHVPQAPLPRPSAGEIESAVKSIRERYKKDFALTSPADQQALASKLLNRAKTAPEEPSVRYALFQEARNLAAKLGKISDAFTAIEASAVWFVADELEEKAKALEAAGTGSVGKEVVESALALVEDAEKRARPDIVDELLRVQALFPSLPDAPELTAKVEAAKKRAASAAADLKRSGQLATEVKKDPDSPIANLQYGKYLCFQLGDWEDGLPKLTKGDDAALKQLAKKETANPKDVKGQLELAREWLDYAPKADDLSKRGVLTRAKYWFEKAVANDLPATERLAVNQKYTEIVKQLASLGGVTLGRRGEAVNRHAFNTLRSQTAFESQWLFIGTDGFTPAGIMLGADASLTSRFKVLDGASVVFSFIPDGRPVNLGIGGEEVSFKPAEETSPIAINVKRNGNDIKLILSSSGGKTLDERTINFPPAKLQSAAIMFSVAGASPKSGLMMKTIVVNGPVKATE